MTQKQINKYVKDDLESTLIEAIENISSASVETSMITARLLIKVPDGRIAQVKVTVECNKNRWEHENAFNEDDALTEKK